MCNAEHDEALQSKELRPAQPPTTTMVAIVVTPEIRSVLSAADSNGRIETTRAVSTISHTALSSAIHQVSSSTSLSSLLSSSEIHLTHGDAVSAHHPPTRDPEVAARVSRLRARLEDAEYARMTRDVARVSSSSNAEVESLRMAKFAPQMSLGVNVVVTMATCFVAGYFVVKNSTGSETLGLVGGIAGLIVALGVEATLLVTRMYSIDNAVETEIRKRQRKAERNAAAGGK